MALIALMAGAAGAQDKTPALGMGGKIAADFPVTFIADANRHTLADVSGAKGTALVFMATDCPIAKRYVLEVGAIHRMYSVQGIRVVAVYSNAGTSPVVAMNQVGTGPMRGMPVLLDTEQKLANTVGATVTPEAVVFDKDFTLRYRGRIDNGFAARGKDRTAGASTGELRDALTSLLAGTPVRVASAPAIGCAIERAKIGAKSAKTPVAVAAATPTYAADIAPLLQKNCITCHRDGEIAMPLVSYSDAQRWATNMAEVTASRFMPPWKPVGDHGKFVGERRLTDAQVATFKKWADAGAPPGNLAKTPPPPKFNAGWKLGKPDLILTMPEAWRVVPRSRDVYRCFVLPTGLKEDKEIVAVEYRPGNPRVVHHALGFIDTTGRARQKDAADPAPGYQSFGGPGFLPSGELGGWAPGNYPQRLPDGVARTLPAGSDMVLQMHYSSENMVEDDVTQIGLYFAKKPTVKKFRTFPLAIRQLDIPAGEANYTVTRTMTVPMDVTILSLTPHMHLLGKTFEMTATLPDGTALPLIQIGDWDFRWQGTYFLREPSRLPRGSKVTLTAVYDNSDANPRNPNNPPRRVTRGEETTDEMCIGFVGFVAGSDDDPSLRLFEGMPEGFSAKN